MSKVADVKRLFDAIFEKFGRVDILVNNAGVMFTKPVVEVGEEELDRLFAVNVKGRSSAVSRRQSVWRRVAGSQITVNVVSPGPTDTELFNQGKSEEQKQRFAQMAALGWLGQPQDIADVVGLLVREDAGWITGQNIRANGGLI
jgi:3-oxoacyl-[acyl-carrier protein] reductase